MHNTCKKHNPTLTNIVPNNTDAYTLPNNIYEYDFTKLENALILLNNTQEFINAAKPATVASVWNTIPFFFFCVFFVFFVFH